MSKILFIRDSVDDPDFAAELGFDPIAQFKLHGDSRVAAATAAGIDYVDISDGDLNYDRLVLLYPPYTGPYDYDLIIHTGHGQFDTMFGDWDTDINEPTAAISEQFPLSLQWAGSKAVYSFSCNTYSYLMPLLRSTYSAVAIAGFTDAYVWSYDPDENASLSDTIFASFQAPGFKFIESLIEENTWDQATTDTLAEFDAQIAYWESGGGSSHVYAHEFAAFITYNKALFESWGTFQLEATSPTTGNISVTTNISDATFDLTGANSYSGSGETWLQTEATAGSYTITFGDVDGYTTPDPQTDTLVAGEMLTFSATYVPIATTGTINVSANIAGATYDLTGANTYSGSGASWSQENATAGQYTITYGDVEGYNTPPPETKTLVAGSSITFTGTYTLATTTGIINVTTNLAGAIFTLYGPSDNYYGSGASWTKNDAEAGTYTVVFNSVVGYSTPSPQTGTLTAGDTLEFIGTYTALTTGGLINVSTNLDDATFTLTGPETLSGSGQTWSESGATAGDYTISYGDVSGYTTPSDETKTLGDGESVTFTGTYVAEAAVGTIEVTTNNASATFTLTGPATYSGSGTSWSQSNAPIGLYTITFGNIAGYQTPGGPFDNLTTGGTISFTGWYTALSQSGTINISCNNDNASFTITGTNTYSGTGRSYSLSNAPVGNYTVSFGDITGYSTPANQSFSLGSGDTITLTGNYNIQSGVDITTSDEVEALGTPGVLQTLAVIRTSEDPKNYYRYPDDPIKQPYSLLPCIPAVPIDAHQNIWEFKTAYDVTTSVWSVTQSGAGTVLTVQDERGGVAKFVNATPDNSFYSYASLYEVSMLSAGLWLQASIRIADVDEADWFFGLCKRPSVGANVFDNRVDAIGFYGVDGSGNVNCECRKNVTSTQTTAIGTLTDDSFVRLQIYVDGTNRAFFYIDGKYATQIKANLPDDEQMCVAFGCRNGKREANEFTISCIQLYQDI